MEDVYVVGILEGHKYTTEVRFVTDVDNRTKFAEWKDGMKAMEFSKEYAKDLAFGLCVNGYASIPMLKAEYMNLKNPDAKRDEEEKVI